MNSTTFAGMRELPTAAPRRLGIPDPIDVAVGARLRLRRLQLGLSQSALGDMLGLTFQQIQKYERGHNRISTSTLVRAANALECSVAFLVGETGGDQLADPVMDKLQTPGVMELLDAYAAVPSKVRGRVIALVRSLGEAGEEPDDE